MTGQTQSLGDLHDVGVGVSLKAQHYSDVLDSRPSVGFFEVHAENYMVLGGPHEYFLSEICQHYPISVHGVGMSLGSAQGLSAAHIKRFRDVVAAYNPILISEHLAWSVEGGHYLNDLLPLPLNDESLSVVADNVKTLQDALSRQILVENPSSYMAFEGTTMTEAEFLTRLCDLTDCGLLLDVNNIYVTARNFGLDAEAYADALPADRVGEIHLAGHDVRDINGVELRIDDHGSAVADPVWDLYGKVIDRIGPRPTLLEWDTNIPDFATLLMEARKAEAFLTTQDDEARRA